MAKLLKIVFGIVGALVLLLALAIGAFFAFFDANAFRGQITEQVKKATGREFALGEVHVSFYPRLGAQVQTVVLGNAAGFGDRPFATVDAADVGLAVLPLLLRHQLQVDGVTLRGLSLDLEKKADGSSNWDDLAKRGGEPKPDEPAKPAGGGFELKSIDIAGVAIENAAIRYADAQAGKRYELNHFNLKTGAIQPSRPFDFALDFATAISDPAVNANVSLASRLNLDPERKLAAIENLALKVKAALPEQKIDLDVAGSIKADYGKLVFGADQLVVKTHAELKDLKADATVSSRIGADLNAKLIKLEKITLDASAEGKALPGGKQAAKVTADAIFDGAKGTLKLADANFAAAGLSGSIALDASGLNGESPRFTGPLSVKPFNARELLATLGVKLETADANALKEVSFKGRLDATKTSARIGDLVLKLDQSTLSGSAGLSDLATQAAEFALKIDTLDADRYLPPKPAQPEPNKPATPEEKAKANAQPLPLDSLDGVNANGTLEIGKLKLNGLSLAAVRAQVNAAKGRDKTIGLNANLYEGSIASTTRITAGARPVLNESLKLAGISAAPLIKDLGGQDRLSGHGNVTVDISGSGKTVGEFKRALNGTLAFSFTDGAVKGFNLGKMLRKADAFLKGQQLTDATPEQTDFSELSASGTISNGVLQSNDLSAKSPLFRVEGAGKVDIAAETIDYIAKPTVVNTASGQGGKELETLNGLTIPIKVGGTFSAPKYSIDLQGAMAQKAGQKLKDRLSDQLDKKLKGDDPNTQQLKDVLKGFLGGKKAQPATPAPVPAAPAPAPAAAPASGT